VSERARARGGLQSVAVCCSLQQSVEVCVLVCVHCVLQRVLQCVLQCVLRCVLQCAIMLCLLYAKAPACLMAAVIYVSCSSVLQCVAACCNVLQRVAVWFAVVVHHVFLSML